MTDKKPHKGINKALIKALEDGELPYADLLLNSGADANYLKSPLPLVRLFKEATCPIRIAIKKDDPKMMKLLISHGTDINKPLEYYSNHMPPIMICIIFKKYNVLKVLAEDIRIDLEQGGSIFEQRSIYVHAQTIKNTDQLLKSELTSQTARDIIKAAVDVRAEKEYAYKQQQIRKTKFSF